MNLNSTIILNNGIEIPILGLGTFLSKAGEEAYNAVRYGLDLGYRHIDTAAIYHNEEDVGKAIKDSGIPREKIFVTTKVWNNDQGYNRTLSAFDLSLKKLNMDYVDLYLIHWPQQGTRLETWKALEYIYSQKKCKSIGISNFTVRHTEELLKNCEIVPAVNQVEYSPYLYQKELQDYSERHKIFIESYSPLTRGKKLNDPKLLAIANKYNKSTAQLLIRWTLQIGTISLPKSTKFNRIKENSEVFDFEISREDMDTLNGFNQDFRIAWDPSTIE